jgi:hypothetical protein
VEFKGMPTLPVIIIFQPGESMIRRNAQSQAKYFFIDSFQS